MISTHNDCQSFKGLAVMLFAHFQVSFPRAAWERSDGVPRHTTRGA